jgi:hypothetical protein
MEKNREFIIKELGDSIDQAKIQNYTLDEEDLLHPKECIKRIKMGIDTSYLVRHFGGDPDNLDESFVSTMSEDNNQDYSTSLLSTNQPYTQYDNQNEEGVQSLTMSKKVKKDSIYSSRKILQESATSFTSINKF